MFKRGGSTGQGITSGLRRQGYAIGDRVTTEDILKSYGPAPRTGYNVYDFLTDWGLRMASATPSGNVLQTGAKQAIEPFAQLTKGKGEAELRDWATKVQATDKSLDINLKKDLAEYAALRQQNQYKKYGVLEPRISYTQDQVKLNMDSSNLTARYFPENMAIYQAAEVYDKTNHPNIMLAPMVATKDKKSEEVDIINGFNDMEKAGVDVASKIFFDPSSGEWFNVVKVGPEWQVDKSEKPIISLEAEEDFGDSSLFKMQTYIKEKEELRSTNQFEVIDEETTVTGHPVNISEDHAKAEAKKRGITIVTLEEKGSKKQLPPNQKTLKGMILLLEKERNDAYTTYMKETYVPKPDRLTKNIRETVNVVSQ